jgi:hypothetical protein
VKANAAVRGIVYVTMLGAVDYGVGRVAHPAVPKLMCRAVTDAASWVLDEAVDTAATRDLPHPAFTDFLASAGEKVP